MCQVLKVQTSLDEGVSIGMIYLQEEYFKKDEHKGHIIKTIFKIMFQTTRLVSTDLKEKFSSGPGFQPGPTFLCSGALPTALPRRIIGPSQNFSLS